MTRYPDWLPLSFLLPACLLRFAIAAIEGACELLEAVEDAVEEVAS